jgi:molybdopterin converting factor small subunit
VTASDRKISVQMFAVARQLAGRSVVELDLPADANVGQLRRQLIAEVPELAPLMPNMMFAVGTEYADDRTKIPPGAEVACIPPVSGG